ncbi:MAG: hypothetical protein WAV20_17285 [Blastocatellia bacterium]
MNIKVDLLRHGLRASLVVLTSLLCYASISTTTSSTAAQESISGEWMIEMKSGTDFVYLTIRRRSERGGLHTSSSNIRMESLAGLASAQAAGSGSNVNFQIVREAGTLNCEGWFKGGNGSGHFTFAPNQSFAAEMRNLGYEKLTDEKLFSMAVHDIGLRFIRELNAVGYDRLSLDHLFAMRIHGANAEFIKELKNEGYDRVPVDNLVAMRIHGVRPEFIRELKALGYEQPPLDQLVAMRIHGVGVEFIKGLQESGFRQPPIDQLIAMRIHGVKNEFIQGLKELGYDRV